MDNNISEAVKILKQGGVVVYPTDTAYGLAVDGSNLAAVKKLYNLKGRDYTKPISVIFPNIKQAEKIVSFGKIAKLVSKKYWPGAVTLALPLKSKLPGFVMLSAKTGTLSVRMPKNDISMALAKALNKPITATSANLSGKPTAYSISEVKKQFAESKNKPDFYLDGGALKKGLLSTMLLVDGKHVTLIREGAIDYHKIFKNIF